MKSLHFRICTLDCATEKGDLKQLHASPYFHYFPADSELFSRLFILYFQVLRIHFSISQQFKHFLIHLFIIHFRFYLNIII